MNKKQAEQKENLHKLITSNKQLQDERRIIERVIEKLEKSMAGL